MEFVRVLYPHERDVEIDNAIVGKTNQVLLVETGMHRFDLGQPVDYEPRFKDVNVIGTIPANPLGILFDVVVPPVPPVPPAADETTTSGGTE